MSNDEYIEDRESKCKNCGSRFLGRYCGNDKFCSHGCRMTYKKCDQGFYPDHVDYFIPDNDELDDDE